MTRHRYGYVDTHGGQMHYAEEGTGDPAILIHHSPASSVMFAKMIPILAERYHVVAPDLPGYGNSTRLPGFELSEVTAVLREFIEEVGAPRAKIFGVHTGSVVAAELTRRCPDLVDSLVLAGFPYLTARERDERLRVIDEQSRGLPGTLPIVVPREDGAHFVARWHEAYRELWWGQNRMPSTTISDEEFEFADRTAIASLIAWRTTPEALRAVYSYDSERLLPSIPVPTLVMHATGAFEGEHLKRSEAVAELIPGARIATVDGDDKYFPYWRAQDVCSIVAEFWDSARQ